MQHYDYLIVGAGLFGSVFAYKTKEQGKKCLVVDRRPHLGIFIVKMWKASMCISTGRTSSIHLIRRCGTLSTRLWSSTATPTHPWQTTRASSTTCRST